VRRDHRVKRTIRLAAVIGTFVEVKTPLAPVLHEPRASATQISQMLYGHCAEILEREGVWLRARGGDGYEGWMHEGYTQARVAGGAVEAWAWGTAGELSLGCSVRDEGGGTLDLPLGAVVGSAHRVSGRTLDLDHRRETFPPDPEAIVASASGLFQGSYYQWGGITPWGTDCSGLVQSVFALHGIRLPRDASQQALQGVKVAGLDELQPADLLFFSDREDGNVTHVAVALGSSRIVHSALGRGGYGVESLSRPDEYVRGLMHRFRFARRVVA